MLCLNCVGGKPYPYFWDKNPVRIEFHPLRRRNFKQFFLRDKVTNFRNLRACVKANFFLCWTTFVSEDQAKMNSCWATRGIWPRHRTFRELEKYWDLKDQKNGKIVRMECSISRNVIQGCTIRNFYWWVELRAVEPSKILSPIFSLILTTKTCGGQNQFIVLVHILVCHRPRDS